MFVGYCIYSPENNWDDFKNVDVSGKIILCLVNESKGTKSEPNLFRGEELTYYGRWMYKIEEARRRNAKGIVLVHTDISAGYPFTVISNQVEQVQFEGVPENPLEIRSWITESSFEKLLGLTQFSYFDLIQKSNSRDFIPIDMKLTCTASMSFQIRKFHGTNVFGVLRGYRNPDEFVVYAAHHDHLGTSSITGDGDEDVIYNGAEDNASGLSLLLGIAKAFSLKPNARSIVFMSFTGEEYGLLGALYYTAHPLFSLKNTLLCINFDIGNVHGKTNDIVGLGAEESGLYKVFTKAANSEKLYVSDDFSPGSGTLLRSDTLAFVKAGIPSIYVFSGRDFVGKPAGYFKESRMSFIEERYHGVSDEFDESWSMDGMMQQLKVSVRVGFEIANK